MLVQFIINCFITASIYVLVGMGFAAVHRTARFFHFAHGAIFTLGAYFTYLCRSWLGFPLYLSILLGITLSAATGCLMELLVYRPLRHKGASSLVLLLASLGVYVALQNTIAVVFGDDTKAIWGGAHGDVISVLGGRVTSIQVIIVCLGMSTAGILAALVKWTRIGLVVRAVSSESELASISGIESDGVILWTFAVGSAVAGLAGVLAALDVDMTPTMGLSALMMGVVAAIIGGRGSVLGVALGAMMLAIAQHLGVWTISSQWREAIAFGILVLFLLFRPQGVLGRRSAKTTV